MTDDERLLEIAARLMAGILGNQTLKVTAKADGATDIEAIAACSFAAADAILNEWRERTGAREERGQDVSDELLNECKQLAGSTGEHSLFFSLDRIMEARTERARAAGKGE